MDLDLNDHGKGLIMGTKRTKRFIYKMSYVDKVARITRWTNPKKRTDKPLEDESKTCGTLMMARVTFVAFIEKAESRIY